MLLYNDYSDQFKNIYIALIAELSKKIKEHFTVNNNKNIFHRIYIEDVRLIINLANEKISEGFQFDYSKSVNENFLDDFSFILDFKLGYPFKVYSAYLDDEKLIIVKTR